MRADLLPNAPNAVPVAFAQMVSASVEKDTLERSAKRRSANAAAGTEARAIILLENAYVPRG